MVAVRTHTDGGTVEYIALHTFTSGWGIAVSRRVGYRGNEWFEVLRVTPPAGPMVSTTMPLSRHDSEAAARGAANAEWRNCRAAGETNR